MAHKGDNKPYKRSDLELFGDIARDDTAAFRVLFERYRLPLYEVALKLAKATDLAEEIVQDVFVRLWVVRQELPAIDHPENFIFRILLNKTTDFLRKEQTRHRMLKMAALHYQPLHSNETEDIVNHHETANRLAEGIALLSEQQRKVYMLNQQQHLSIEETAAALHISIPTVKTHLAKAREFLRNYLKDVATITILLSCWK